MLLRLEPSPSAMRWQRVRALSRSAVGWSLSLSWLVCFGGLLGCVVWMILDPYFADAAAWVDYDLRSVLPSEQAVLPDASQEPLELRQRLMEGLAFAWIISSALIVFGLMIGPVQHRRLASWLGVFTVACMSIALAMAWTDLLWYGRTVRVSRQMDGIETTAVELREDWPLVDGEVAGVGPFSAYPYGRATLLLRLTQHEDRPSELTYQSIERSTAGGLRFQLGGAERGAWLEWHPDGELPASFQGGLEAQYKLVRYSHLREGWYLAKYRSMDYAQR